MYDRIILMGRLTRDPEMRKTQNGTPMCSFSIAVDRPRRRDAEKQTDFFNIIAWNKTAEFVGRYFQKGQMIHIEGALRNDFYTDNNGVKHYNAVIVADSVAFCGTREQTADPQRPDPYAANGQRVPQQYAAERQRYEPQHTEEGQRYPRQDDRSCPPQGSGWDEGYQSPPYNGNGYRNGR